MKKYYKFSVLMSILLVFTMLLAACAPREEPPVVEEPVVEEPVVEEPEVEEPVVEEPEDRFTIGISNPFISSEYRTQMIDNLITVNAEYMEMGYTNELVIESFDTDVAGQIEQLENLINAGVDAILVNPGDAVALNQILEEAVDMGILVLSIDQEIEAEGVINVGHDQFEWARISAQWFADNLQEGDVVLIEGFIGHPANELRMSAVYDVLDNYPDINVLASESGFWDQATGQGVMSDFLAAYPNLDGYWTQDGMALGALEAVIAAEPDPRPLGTGEGRVNFLRLWGQMLEQDPDFETIAVANAPGVNATALRIAVEILSGNELNTEVLGGQYGTTIVIDVPIVVTPENFAEVYEEYVASGDYPDSYLLDGIMTRDEVIGAFFSEIVDEPVVEEPEVEPREFKAAMLTDLGGLAGGEDVKGFSDLGWDALQKAEQDLGIEITLLEATELADLEPNLRKMASEGYDFVVGVGFLFTDAMAVVAPEFPDTHFAIVDSVVEEPNVASLVFAEEEGSFLVGAIAAGMSETGVIGFIGGMEIPLIEKFEAGYVAGARSINPDIRVLSNYAGNFHDVAAGKEIGLTQHNQGADVIFAAAGSVGLGTIEAASEQGFWAIGVDIDQDGVSPGDVLVSMLKRVEVAVYEAVRASYESTFEGGIYVFDLAAGGVGYSDMTYTRDQVPAELLETVDALAERIIAGEIQVPTTRAEADAFLLP